ncbi:LLM class flavin-dependent oxidoreductase [Kutzneria sp. 744]|uniref:LLM class flavin-dependent oxidoreductase n=1 Tax=Kutzneria sp. (strain 744) TaxID=345341 RepID=UPI0003EED689|nr:F420-dependent oxidoreductase [Kutzneria sp. 744]
MTIGAVLPAGDALHAKNIVDELIAQTREASTAGLTSVWFTQLFDHDAISLAALAGREVPGIEVGTAVVPLYSRHPLVIASLAQTAQAATDGRFTLGVGLGVRGLLEPAYGLEYPPPIRLLRESLEVLNQALDGEQVSFAGSSVIARPPLPTAVAGGDGVQLLVAAMAPQTLRATAEFADAPFRSWPGRASSNASSCPPGGAPSSHASSPPCPPSSPIFFYAVRAVAAASLGYYGDIPSYRQILDAEGVDHPADLALIGSEAEVAAGIRRYFDAGATDVVLIQSGMRSAADRLRTWQLAGQCVQASPNSSATT